MSRPAATSRRVIFVSEAAQCIERSLVDDGADHDGLDGERTRPGRVDSVQLVARQFRRETCVVVEHVGPDVVPEPP